jgi:hypothetical protein
MHFGTKSYLKSTYNHTAKHALSRLGHVGVFSYELILNLDR